MVTQLLAAAGVLALLTIIPGPDMAVVTRRALIGGPADALRTGAGIVCGLLMWGSLAVLGLTALLTAFPTPYLVLKLAGVAYLAYLGLQAFRRGGAPEVSAEPGPVPGRAFVTGLTSNLLNPKIAVFYTALLPTLAPPELGHTAGMTALVLIHAVLTLGWITAYVGALTRAQAVFARPRVRRALDRVTGVVLIGFAVRLAAEKA